MLNFSAGRATGSCFDLLPHHVAVPALQEQKSWIGACELIKIGDISGGLFGSELSERERDILLRIIQLYILKAAPIGSRVLAKYLSEDIRLSSASIRNVMADLEEMEYISHPHTSAGRIPTDKGYRFYVNSLKAIEELSERELTAVKDNLSAEGTENVLAEATRLLGTLSRYLSVVQLPSISDYIVHKIELVPLSSTRMLVVIALDSNIVRTVTLETRFEILEKDIDNVKNYINERISGKTLKFIRENFKDLVKELGAHDTPVIRLFTESLDKLFRHQTSRDRVILAGTQNLLDYPEFEDLTRVRSVIELIENEDMIIHIMDRPEEPGQGVQVLIGREIRNDLLDDYSVVFSNFTFGSALGSIGLIGPKRMNYPRMISLVDFVAKALSSDPDSFHPPA